MKEILNTWFDTETICPGDSCLRTYVARIDLKCPLLPESQCGGGWPNGKAHECIAIIKFFIIFTGRSFHKNEIKGSPESINDGMVYINCVDSYHRRHIQCEDISRVRLMEERYHRAPPRKVLDIIEKVEFSRKDISAWMEIDQGSPEMKL